MSIIETGHIEEDDEATKCNHNQFSFNDKITPIIRVHRCDDCGRLSVGNSAWLTTEEWMQTFNKLQDVTTETFRKPRKYRTYLASFPGPTEPLVHGMSTAEYDAWQREKNKPNEQRTDE